MKISMNNLKIGKKLTGGVILLLIMVIVILSQMSYRQAYNSVHNQISTNAPQIASYGAELIRTTLDKHIGFVIDLTENSDISSMDWNRQRPVLEKTVKRLGYFQLGIILPDGSVTLNDGSKTNVKDRPYFQTAMSGVTDVSDIFIHRILKVPVMTIAVPIKDDANKVKGIILAVMEATWLSDITDKIRYGDKGYSYIIDGKGTTIAYPDRADVVNQRNLIEESKKDPTMIGVAAMFQKMIQRETGFDEYEFSGSKRIFGFAPISGTSWSIAVGAHKENVFKEIFIMRRNIHITSLILILLSGSVMVFFSRGIVNPIVRATPLLESVSKGDFSIRVESKSGDEIGIIMKSINAVIEMFIEVVVTINESTRQITGMIQSLSSSSQETSAVTNQQAAAVKEIVSTMEDADTLAKTIDKRIKEVTQTTERARKIVTEGFNKVQASMEKMNEINTSNVTTIEGINFLNEKINSIWEIVKMINGVADQTKIIAFNAELEASAAGEAGKNFQIVASEIRRLADNTVRSTTEIREKIGEIQKSSDRLLLTSQTGTEKIKEGNSLTTEINDMFKDILTDSEASSIATVKISETIRQQVSSFEQILLALRQISDGVENAAISTKETSNVVDSLQQMVELLNELLAQYKIQ